ncbi:protein of unknown function [Flagellimonas taeanensis]|uniref:DUF4832 domain-containing protein n=1 Tax=Flagellimonas taeanensis TaxID=1005926 RepID=A0A1M6Z7W1_9FLAO|nr:DUF4832 domain-containing protein [Allomuricauda taeanensis]SFC11146.1 protein of unknown function [Allomuricauda taeanensis]SHL26409.1 protein of unknown function [Allomuricauda taeanensis]
MKYKFITLFILCIISCGSDGTGEAPIDPEPVDDTINAITYTASNEVIPNPERGFMHHWAVESEGSPLSEAMLNALKNEKVSIINRIYYLDTFKDADLSTAQLNLITTDFERLRTSGVKCILRFAYNSNQNETDAPLSRVLAHLDQLQPVLTDNADVIAFVQAGFIGSWGEWYYTTNNLTTLENKRAVLNKLLEVLPKEIKVQVRTPLYKQEIFEYSTAMDASVGYGESDVARVGFHNDCFLASPDDYGTYQNIAAEKEYISKEALFVPTGGETCPPSGVPTASCSTADSEMSLLKWTYLNLDYYGPVLQEWRNNDCFEDFQKELGYRLVMKTASLKKEATLNGNFELALVLENAGFAPIYNKKNAFLVFKSVGDGTMYKKALGFDVRKVVPDSDFDLKESIGLEDIPAGEYKLYIKIEDASTSLKDRPEYAIQLANSGTWEASTGMNELLHSLTIN